MVPQSSWENTVLQLSWWKALFLCQMHFVKQFKAFYQLSGSCLPQGNACERSGQAGTQTAEVISYLATSPHLPVSAQSAGIICWEETLLKVLGCKWAPYIYRMANSNRLTEHWPFKHAFSRNGTLGMLSQCLPAVYFFCYASLNFCVFLGHLSSLWSNTSWSSVLTSLFSLLLTSDLAQAHATPW